MMKKHFSFWSVCLFPILVGVAAAAETTETETTIPLLWASTGGGWRAMFADVGYANIFQQAGLFTESSSRFSGVVRTISFSIKKKNRFVRRHGKRKKNKSFVFY